MWCAPKNLDIQQQTHHTHIQSPSQLSQFFGELYTRYTQLVCLHFRLLFHCTKQRRGREREREELRSTIVSWHHPCAKQSTDLKYVSNVQNIFTFLSSSLSLSRSSSAYCRFDLAWLTTFFQFETKTSLFFRYLLHVPTLLFTCLWLRVFCFSV